MEFVILISYDTRNHDDGTLGNGPFSCRYGGKVNVEIYDMWPHQKQDDDYDNFEFLAADKEPWNMKREMEQYIKFASPSESFSISE